MYDDISNKKRLFVVWVEEHTGNNSTVRLELMSVDAHESLEYAKKVHQVYTRHGIEYPEKCACIHQWFEEYYAGLIDENSCVIVEDVIVYPVTIKTEVLPEHHDIMRKYME